MSTHTVLRSDVPGARDKGSKPVSDPSSDASVRRRS